MKHLKLGLITLLCILTLLLAACGGSGSNATKGIPEEIKNHELHLIIEYETNVIFAKYDIDIYVDNDKIGFLSQGQTFDYSLEITEGKHNITVKNSGDASEKASTEIFLDQDKVYLFNIKAHTNSIDIKSQEVLSKAEYEKQQKELNPEDESTESADSMRTDKDSKQDKEKKSDSLDANTETNGDAEANKITEIDAQLNTYIGKPVSQLIPYVDSIGYSASYTAQNTGDDFTDWLKEEPYIGDNFIIQSISRNHQSKTLQVYWLGTETLADQTNAGAGSGRSAEDRLNDTLDEFIAWQAVVDYGRNIYGRGFKVHYIMDKQAAVAENENTWFLKAGCTMPEGQNCTVEANVTGSDDYYYVTYFLIY